MTARPALPSVDLMFLTDEEFAARWRDLMGELPAVMLPDRAEMIELLVESVAPADAGENATKPAGKSPACASCGTAGARGKAARSSGNDE